MEILIAGVGNVLRGDDGFGVHVAQALARKPLHAGVRVTEVGISGLALVYELMDGCDACIIVDASRRGGDPGALYVLEPSEVAAMSASLGVIDPHTAEPGRALLLAQAWGARPKKVYVVACEPAETEDLTDALSAAAAVAVEPAVNIVLRLIERLQGEALSGRFAK